MGKVMNIQRFCVDDGPGIRTTVFLSGCPLKCLWCHNPESWKINGKLFYYPEKCVSCGKCTLICDCHSIVDGKHQLDRSKCISCGKCVATGCNALEMSAKDYSVQEVMDIVLKDQRYYENSKGGVTFSGGEPMVQFEFLKELMKQSKENGLHVCLETCGYAPTEKYLEISKYVDLFLYDYKMTDEKTHIQYTGVSNQLILENLKALNDTGDQIVLRCIIVPGVNDNEEHFDAIGHLADQYDGIIEVDVEPYHDLGNSKRERLGEEKVLIDIKPVDKQEKERYLSRIKTKKKVVY